MSLDLTIYRQYNPDLKDMSDAELQQHYERYGKYESHRIADQTQLDAHLKDFVPCDYRELNPDLLGLDDTELKDHFLRFGRMERRKSRKVSVITLNETDYEFVRKVNFDEAVNALGTISRQLLDTKKEFLEHSLAGISMYVVRKIYQRARKLDSNTQRYIYQKAIVMFIESLYQRGQLDFTDFRQLSKEAGNCIKLFDQQYMDLISTMTGCCGREVKA